ncbi:MAG: class I SAM-dependent methyltransferase [Alphaproteobacteria bacterium]
MADWGSGYVTDTAYVHDYCRVQTPPILSFAALCKGVAAPGILGEPLRYCDLGCGQGFTANIIAAANARTEVFAADFNPTHIANARGLAQAAGLKNIAFREADFAELSNDTSLPEFDIIALHGVYSWVSAENRRAIVAFIRRRLKSGGAVYISYDTMPGWAGIAPLRRLMLQQHSVSPQASSQKALEQALALVDRLKDAGAQFYKMYPHVTTQLERLRKLPSAYLAHELLTRDWQAFSFADVAAELAEAKLTYLGSAHLMDHVDRVNFTEDQQRLLGGIADPLTNESARDMIVGRQFRRDVFVKGFTRLATLAERERWLQMRLVLSNPAKDVSLTFETPLGTLQLRPEIYRPVIDALAEGPVTVRELIERLPGGKLEWGSLTDAIKVLVGRGDLQVALPAEHEAERAQAAQAFNTVVMGRAKEQAPLAYLASPVTGGGIQVGPFTQLYLHAKRKGVADPITLIANFAAASGRPFEKDGKALSPEEARGELAAKAAHIDAHVVPLLGRLGIV